MAFDLHPEMLPLIAERDKLPPATEIADIRRMGSAALDLCSVAMGRVDAYYEDPTQRWDWPAGAVIARSAGAVVTPLVGPSGTNGVLAAGPGLHAELAAVLAEQDVEVG